MRKIPTLYVVGAFLIVIGMGTGAWLVMLGVPASYIQLGAALVCVWLLFLRRPVPPVPVGSPGKEGE